MPVCLSTFELIVQCSLSPHVVAKDQFLCGRLCASLMDGQPLCGLIKINDGSNDGRSVHGLRKQLNMLSLLRSVIHTHSLSEEGPW